MGATVSAKIGGTWCTPRATRERIFELFKSGATARQIAARLELPWCEVVRSIRSDPRYLAYRRLLQDGNPHAAAHRWRKREWRARARAALGALCVALVAFPAPAAPPSGADPNSPTARWYRSLRQPGTGLGCCDQSDCRQTQAREIGGAWEAQTPEGEWVPVPANRVITDQTHPAGSAVLCYIAGRVLCFVPPAAGG